MASASFSKETIPLFRALVAYAMISSTMGTGSWSRSKKTRPSFFTAPMRVCIGVVTITAPIVPQRTMMAAVTWATSFTLPPSSTRPPSIPPTARIKPPRVAKSGLPPDFFFGEPASAIDFVWIATCGRLLEIQPSQRTLACARNDGPSKPDNALHYLISRFQHHDLLPRSQGNHRVGGHLHVLDEIRVQD